MQTLNNPKQFINRNQLQIPLWEKDFLLYLHGAHCSGPEVTEVYINTNKL